MVDDYGSLRKVDDIGYIVSCRVCHHQIKSTSFVISSEILTPYCNIRFCNFDKIFIVCFSQCEDIEFENTNSYIYKYSVYTISFLSEFLLHVHCKQISCLTIYLVTCRNCMLYTSYLLNCWCERLLCICENYSRGSSVM